MSSRNEIVESLTAFPERLRRATSGIDASSAREKPSSDGWSLIEQVCHLRDYADIFNSRLIRAVSEDNPRVALYDNEDLATSREYLAQNLEQVLTALSQIRTNMLGTIARLTEDDWRRTLQHATWGQPTVEWILNRCVEHEQEHLEEIERSRR